MADENPKPIVHMRDVEYLHFPKGDRLQGIALNHPMRPQIPEWDALSSWIVNRDGNVVQTHNVIYIVDSWRTPPPPVHV